MKLADLGDGEMWPLVSLGAACAIDIDGNVQGVVQRGHHAPWSIKRYAESEHGHGYGLAPEWPKRTYMRDVPWSLMYPDEPPCDDGEESVIWEECKRTTPGAIPMTVLRFERVGAAPSGEERA